jgi:hypothetical protein
VLAEVPGGHHEVVPDDGVGVLCAPPAAVLGDRARTRTRSSTARCRPACRPCPTAPPRGRTLGRSRVDHVALKYFASGW